MALQEVVQSITIEAGGDLSSHQFKFVIVAADGQVDLSTTAGGPVTGVLQNEPAAAGRAATVAYAGVAKVIAGATIAAGNKIQSSVTGLADVATTADHVVGTALTGGASGALVSVLLVSQHII